MAVGVIGAALTGCLPQAMVRQPPSSPAQSPPNSPPEISGQPGTSVLAGTQYSFQPAASDPEGDPLGFSVANKPAWASFNPSTGALSGMAQAGTYQDIEITVSDGHGSQSMTFTLVVSGQPATDRSAQLSWSAPVRYVDGDTLSPGDLAGYRLYHGNSANALDDVVEVSGAGESTYTFRQLEPGIHYFAVSAITMLGTESALTQVRTKTIL